MSVPKGHLELLKKVSHSCTTLFILDQGLIQAGPGLIAKDKTRIPHDGGASRLSTQTPKPHGPGERSRRGGEQIMSVWVV